MSLDCIPLEEYSKFAKNHFRNASKQIDEEVIAMVYRQFEGITWYIQRIMNELFSITQAGGHCSVDMTTIAISNILRANEFNYQSILFQLPPKQKELLIAICKEGKAQNLTSSAFIQKYHLPGSSSVQSAIKGLIEKNFVTSNLGVYEVYDKFFAIWLLLSR